MAAAAKHLTPVVLELGGKCPAIVDSNVDLKVKKRIAYCLLCRLNRSSKDVISELSYDEGCCKKNASREVGLQQRASLHSYRLHCDNKVICSEIGKLVLFNRSSKSLYVHKGLFVLINVCQQVDALQLALEEFFGKNPLESQDMSRIVNLYHFKRLAKLLDEDGTSDKIVLGGQRDENNL